MTVIDTSKDLSALFLQQVKATPDAVALEDGPTTLTYAELDRKVDALSTRLRHDGVGRDSLVGVLLGRSADYVISCLAALRAGGAFLVLELAYPPSLLAAVIEDARPTVIITHMAHFGKINYKTPLIVLDDKSSYEDGDALSNGTSKTLPPLPAEDDLEKLAFVSYSSGTTGKPKGIANPHRAAVLSYDLRFGVNDLKPGDRVACNVFFVWEILRPLLRGATVVTVPDETSYDPVALVELLRSKAITETLMTPTLLATVLARHSQLGARLPDLRTVWLNGEVVTTDLARRGLKALPKARLLNCYSASETHEIACGDIRDMVNDEARVVPVGPPLDPEHTYILDEDGKKVETGVSGELFVGGKLLARGYLNLPEATAKAFTDDPFNQTSGARMYRTGDTARLLPSGLLEITGRVGAMIKIRGYSVQPPAVENAIIKHLAVRNCVVIAHGDGLDRQLLAYIVPDEDEPGDRTVVKIDEAGFSPVARRALSDHLAHYMIPALWVELDSLPTHEVSGKVDLKRLPPPTKSRSPASSLAPQHRNQKITVEDIAKMWAASLNIPYKSIMQQEHDFFDLGGHSLALVDLVTRFTGTYGFPVALSRLAGNPTLKGHLEVVCDARDGHTASVQADLPAVLRADSVLPPEIKPSGAKMQRISDADTILLTGTTGFLGAFLLSTILETTSAQVVCLVRFADLSRDNYSAGVARIRKNLLDLGLWNDSILDRIEVIPSNLARKRFGLSPEGFEDLASRVQVIIHSAATVNLVYPYAAMQGANIFGTREILRLACRGGATVHHISTNGVLPPSVEGWSEDAMLDVDEVPEKLIDGYGQTKWVAEQLVLEAAKRGLPARIYRPGTISGHSVSGSSNTYDLLNALIVESLQLGHAPDIEGWYAEMTPVDFVSKAITSLADLVDTDQRIFHLGDPSPVPTKDIFGILGELGYPTEPLGWDEWVGMWEEKRGSSKGDNIFTVDILRRGMPTVDFLKWVTVLKDPATEPALAKTGLQRPKIDNKLFETYTRHFCARGWLPRAPRRTQTNGVAKHSKRGPLAGRVAVVTGASSGIGAAVATALAREGAHVAIAARRTEALEDLKNKLSSSGSRVLVQKTDVTDRKQVESLMQTATEKLGPVDILVSCAGVMYYTMMANVHMEEWERTVDVNCKGLLHCLSSTVPSMLSRGGGHIVAISSDAGRKVFPGLGVYSASKFFVEATLQSLRLETAGSGLRVTSVQPGNTATDLLSMSTDAEAIKKYGEPTGAKVLHPEEVASAIIYALRQPAHVAVNEVLIEPRDEPI
ncbi:Linear gramicidin synthase subunit D [Daldinia childiae]|uniref:Linear gramicidin synthase subunit D n=2 Tax=Daldinia childiae TaxID=326645 RepID=UPI00144509ED|nr:Linear gramicidin synthase subunit D [Daldinia childiae]KAF3060933.1 Linear gramicidin synthase subunit D [Daldinia childiae]